MSNATLQRMYQQAMTATKPKPDPRKGMTASEWSEVTGKSEPQSRRDIRRLVRIGKMIADRDWRTYCGASYKVPVYRFADKKARRDE